MEKLVLYGTVLIAIECIIRYKILIGILFDCWYFKDNKYFDWSGL